MGNVDKTNAHSGHADNVDTMSGGQPASAAAAPAAFYC